MNTLWDLSLNRVSLTVGEKRKPPLMVDVCVDGCSLRMKLDTGAALSVCSRAVV